MYTLYFQMESVFIFFNKWINWNGLFSLELIICLWRYRLPESAIENMCDIQYCLRNYVVENWWNGFVFFFMIPLLKKMKHGKKQIFESNCILKLNTNISKLHYLLSTSKTTRNQLFNKSDTMLLVQTLNSKLSEIPTIGHFYMLFWKSQSIGILSKLLSDCRFWIE